MNVILLALLSAIMFLEFIAQKLSSHVSVEMEYSPIGAVLQG